MENYVKRLKLLTASHSRKNGIQDTVIPSLKIIRATTLEKTHQICKPCLCVVVQGSKDITLGSTTYSYSPGECIVASVDLPVTGQVTQASVKHPYFCLML